MCFMFCGEIAIEGKASGGSRDSYLCAVFVTLCVLREFNLCLGDSITPKKSRAEVKKRH